jgi:class 3 adenylate cyclase/tetratricopeptide (TPR) repeat protein
MPTCPSCGTENPDGFNFCGKCGAQFTATPVHEERKVITALFCDLVGSTALGERLDAEDLSRLLREYQALCRKGIESHGGVVEKFIGDAVVGVFGVPLAHEDDAERAVKAALRIREDIGAADLGIEVRIGVNTGEALVRLDVDPRSREGFATGDTMNTAARLEAAAPAMGVAVGARTRKASMGAIVYEELAPIAAKGKSEPVEAWRALHPTARIGTEERDRTPFVGRDLELSMLIQLFDRSRARPSTEFVTIIAEPGLGKSRLVRELARYAEDLPQVTTWHEGRCLPYGDGISFRALGEIVKTQSGILETDDQPTVSAKLDRSVPEPDPQTRAWIKDRLAPLVGLETTTEPPTQEEAFAAWRRFLEGLAAAAPTVLVIEDLHWADEAFVTFLEHIAERTAGLPLLIVVTARPEVEERHPSWPPGRRSTTLSLSPLTDEDLEALITSLPEVDGELISIVLERAGGSPLYAEQLAAMLREQALPIAGGALDETLIPTSVQALIAARIDALPSDHKRVLMEASVVGKSFWAGAVSSLGEHEDLDATVSELVRREFCRPVHPSTMAGDLEFGFWHALVRDVAYAELTKTERGRMHATTARWIVGRSAGAIGEDAEIVVHHIDAAFEFASAAPEFDTDELSELLATALIAAGEAAMRTQVPRAIPYLERALGAFRSDDDRRPVVLRLLGQAKASTGDLSAAAALFTELLAHKQAMRDEEGAADAMTDLSPALWAMGEGAQADRLVVEMKERLGPAPSTSLAKLLALEAEALALKNDNEASTLRAAESIEMAEALGFDPSPVARLARGISRMALGDREGEGDIRSAGEVFAQNGDSSGAVVAILDLAYAAGASGPTVSLPYFEEATELAERFGMDGDVQACRAARLGTLASLGRFDEVLNESGPILDWVADHYDAFSRREVLASLAVVETERGDGNVDPTELADLARRTDDEAPLIAAAQLALGRGNGDIAPVFVLEGAPRARLRDAFGVARACVELGLPEVAEELLARHIAHYPVEDAARLHASACLAEARGELVVASEEYTSAAALLQELEVAPDQAHALQGLGRCLLGLGDVREGAARLLEARALWEEMKATPRIVEIDELLSTTQP